MLSWLMGLSEIFKDSNGHWNWPWIGIVLFAAGTAIAKLAQGICAVFKFRSERKKADEKMSLGPTSEQIEQIQKPWVDLANKLLERNPAAAGPGAQQAVGEAVQSIAQGAAEGDKCLKQALDLLKENKIADTTQLLNAFAEDKTVRIEKDRKEAAIAYRNLGAIAGLAGPKRALEAYEKAVAFDPDDIESLFWAGYLQIEYGNLAHAQTRLERVQKLAQSDDQTFYKYAAAGSLGDVKQRRGDITGALQSYRDTIPIIDRLAKADPGNAGWQRDLSVSYNKIAGVQQAQGDLGRALKSYSDSLAIRDRLTNADPGNAGWQRDLALSFGKLALVHKQSGDRAKARDYLRQGQPIMARLTKLSPDNAQWEQDLANFDRDIAELAER
jgi:tetratricopeptide (TPR) repeat protein